MAKHVDRPRRNFRRNPKDRCLLCGLRIVLHFTPDNRKLTCQEATEAHPRASVRAFDFVEALQASLDGPSFDTREEARGEW